jgi:DNA polymerase-3 subunit beta
MQFEIDQSALLSSLALAQTVADRRHRVLDNVLIRAGDEGVVFSSTDTMIALTESVACKVTEPGALCIGVHHLHSVAKTLPPGAVKVNSLYNSWAQIRASRSEFKLMGIPEGDFPELPDPGDVSFTSIPSHRFVDLIEKTLFSVSTDEARINLNGALFESDGSQATMVSTDGHRLTKYSLDLAGPELANGIIIPRKGLEELRRVLSTGPRPRTSGEGYCDIGVDGGHLFVRFGSLTASVATTRSSFPPYGQVIPKDYTRRVEANRVELIAALRQAAVIAPDKTSTVRLDLKRGSIELHADNPELGAISLDMPVTYDGADLSSGFNATYLIEALGAIVTDAVLLDFTDELSPVVLRPAGDEIEAPDLLAVIMPMRI